MTAKILAVGDVCGSSGLDFLKKHLRSLIRINGVAFTVVNGENVSGVGITPAQAEDILDTGADVITLGNHVWGRREITRYLDDCPRILRPLNFAPQTPGRGSSIFEAAFGNVRVINLIGRCGMNYGPDNPFFAADKALKEQDVTVNLVEIHAEATSEKLAMGHYLDGRVSAVWGTHTHVQTSDAGVLPKGTGFICELGMTGPINSVIGIAIEGSISNFLGNPPRRNEAATGPCKLECALFTIDTSSGRCLEAEALRIT